MQINESRENEILILGPVGHLDTRTQGDFEKVVLEKLQGGERRFIVDMVDVEYLASAGLRVLLMLAKKLKSTEGQLVICGMNEHVLEVFNVAGFSTFFTINPTRDEALATLGSIAEVDPAAAKLASLTSRLLETSRGDGEDAAPPTEEAVAVAKRVAAIFGVPQEEPKPKPKPKPKPVDVSPAAVEAPKPEPAKPAPAVPMPAKPAPAVSSAPKSTASPEETVKMAPLDEQLKGCLGALMFWKR
jgi:anti-anti-sigma factor